MRQSRIPPHLWNIWVKGWCREFVLLPMSSVLENKKDLPTQHLKKSKVYSAWRTINSAFFGTVWKRERKEREKEGKSPHVWHYLDKCFPDSVSNHQLPHSVVVCSFICSFGWTFTFSLKNWLCKRTRAFLSLFPQTIAFQSNQQQQRSGFMQ